MSAAADPAGFIAALKAQPDRPLISDDPQVIDSRFRYWRARILTTSIFGYAVYYLVRANIGVPLKVMGDDLGYSKTQLGVIITLGGLTYGVSKFFNGMLGDRSNPRYFMAIGLIASAAMNVFFGLSSTLLFLASFWVANMWAQGMGFPPCARNMAYWFTPKERGTTFGIWHVSHMIGAAAISAITGYLVHYYGWRACFYVPAAMAVVGAVIVMFFLRDTPGSLGLPAVEIYKGEETPEQLARELHEPVPTTAAPDTGVNATSGTLEYESPKVQEESYLRLVYENVLKSPYMWVISIANLLVYILRETQSKWGPTFLQETKHMTVVKSGWLGTGSELAGAISALAAGIIADRFFGGKAGRVCCVAMLLMAGVVYAFWKTPGTKPHLVTSLYVAMGFLLYVPQMLIAAMAMNLGTKRAAAAAVGLTGIIGYLGTASVGVGMGWVAQHWGWDTAFKILMGCAMGTLVLMAFTWNVGAHPHGEPAVNGRSETR